MKPSSFAIRAADIRLEARSLPPGEIREAREGIYLRKVEIFSDNDDDDDNDVGAVGGDRADGDTHGRSA